MVHDGMMVGRMDGWMDGRMDGWMDGRVDGWMDGWMDGWTDGGIGWIPGWVVYLIATRYLKSSSIHARNAHLWILRCTGNLGGPPLRPLKSPKIVSKARLSEIYVVELKWKYEVE